MIMFKLILILHHIMSSGTYRGMCIEHNDGRRASVLDWCAILSSVPRGGDRRYESASDNYPYFRTRSTTYPQGIGGYIF